LFGTQAQTNLAATRAQISRQIALAKQMREVLEQICSLNGSFSVSEPFDNKVDKKTSASNALARVKKFYEGMEKSGY